MKNISTDRAIELIAYSIAQKQERGIDMELSVKAAKDDLLGFWERDMIDIEQASMGV